MDMLDWSLLRSFLAVAESGSLSAAAELLSTTQPTVGRHIAALEADMGVTLFHRSRKGLEPTPAAFTLLEDARVMGQAADGFARKAAGQVDGLSGTVRITASRVMSCFVLPDILAKLRQAEPQISVEIVASDETQNLLRRDADIALRMFEPRQRQLVRRKLGDLPLGIYASATYLARKGRPAALTDLLAHDVIGFDRQDDLLDGFAQMGYPVERHFFPLRTDDHVLSYQLLVAGAGIGFALRLVADADPRLEHLLLTDALPGLPMWLVMHEDVRHNARIRFVWDFLARTLKERLAQRLSWTPPR